MSLAFLGILRKKFPLEYVPAVTGKIYQFPSLLSKLVKRSIVSEKKL
jgi:hypothetical protein